MTAIDQNRPATDEIEGFLDSITIVVVVIDFPVDDGSIADTLTPVHELLQQSRALAGQKNYLEAERICLEASELARELVGDESPFYGLCLEELGAIRVCQGKMGSAAVTLATAQNILEKALGPDHAHAVRVASRLQEICHS
jgi:hypothetical protein